MTEEEKILYAKLLRKSVNALIKYWSGEDVKEALDLISSMMVQKANETIQKI